MLLYHDLQEPNYNNMKWKQTKHIKMKCKKTNNNTRNKLATMAWKVNINTQERLRPMDWALTHKLNSLKINQ